MYGVMLAALLFPADIPADQLQLLIGDVQAVIVRNQTEVTAELIAAAANLKVIGRAGAGLDNVDVTAATEAGVVVTYAPCENSLSVAELTIGLMISLARQIPAAATDTRCHDPDEQGNDLRHLPGLNEQKKPPAKPAVFLLRLEACDDYMLRL